METARSRPPTETQQKHERREQAADRAVRPLQTALSAPAIFQKPPGEGAVLVIYPDGPALFHAESKVLPEAPMDVFREGEDFENHKSDLKMAAACPIVE